MKSYENYLKTTYHCKVTYLNYDDDLDKVFAKHKKIEIFDPVDFDITHDFKKLAKKHNTDLFMYDSPLFLCKISDLLQYLESDGKYHQTSFYIWQRKRLNILISKNDKPVGGKWTYDKENRLPFPKEFKKDVVEYNDSKYIEDAKKYVDNHFPKNPGETNLYLPIDHQGTKKYFEKFLKEKLDCFGPYQDAVDRNIIFGCHSILSPLINIGLITPSEIVDGIIEYYKNHKVKLSSVEGLIRQIIGWREFMRMVYVFKHKELVKNNHFNHKRKLGKEWYIGETNIEPIDDIIHKTLKYGYAHHIERLMYLGNFMLLNEIDPHDINTWFTELFIDSYQWVMEPNVYGMSQYASGPLLSTRPYFSSSNYINKMSSYKKSNFGYKKIKLNGIDYEWHEIWDALYYNFINNNKKEFSKNYAIASAVGHWNNKSQSDKTKILSICKNWFLTY